jgi:hypothetical protein
MALAALIALILISFIFLPITYAVVTSIVLVIAFVLLDATRNRVG